MSEKPHGATTIRASKGGGGGKILIGAIVAAALVGGGYLAWKNYTPSQTNTELAYDDSYATDPLRAGPMDSESYTAESAAAESAAEPASAQPRTQPARRVTTARAEPIPEQTIGITPISATTETATPAGANSDEIVVTARRPIWASTPTARRLSSLYPERALERGREGEARLACIVQQAGVLDCERVSATPGGFGTAAMQVARGFRHSSTLADGSSATGTPVNLRVIFRIEDQQRS